MADTDDITYPGTMAILIPNEYLVAIGQVCVMWGQLEAIVDLAISKMSGHELTDPRGAILTAHMTWPLKMDILESLVNALKRDHPHLAKFKDAKALLKEAQRGRNRVVHGQWVYQEGKVMVLRMTARGELDSRIDTITIPQIDAIVDTIGRAGAATLKMVVNK